MKKGIGTLLIGVLFLFAAIIYLIAYNMNGFVPDEAIGAKQVRLLETKEEAVNVLMNIDQAVKYGSYHAVLDVASNGPVKEGCGFHINPVINNGTNCYDDNYEKYLINNVNFYLDKLKYRPVYDFFITKGENTQILAKSQGTIKVSKPIDFGGVTTTGQFSHWPSKSFIINSCYGKRIVNGEQDVHDGIDIDESSSDGSVSEVFAVAKGIVEYVCIDDCNPNINSCTNKCGGYGSNIILSHENGMYTRYSHLGEVSKRIKKGEVVEAGQPIALTGNSGDSTGDHLDFKVFLNKEKLPSSNGGITVDGGSTPFCFFSSNILEKIAFSDDADSCKIKYGTATLLEEGYPLVLQAECSDIAVNSGNTDDIPKEALDRSVQFDSLINEESNKRNIPSALVKSIFTQESKFDPLIISATGAAGIAQFTGPTAEGFGLEVTPCCTKKEADAFTCNKINPPRCNIENDERFNPEIAIPAAIEYIARIYERHEGNVFLTAVEYNAGNKVADKMKADCGEITAENAVECAKDATILYFDEKKYEREIVPYLENMKKYFPAWGGILGNTRVLGTFYEVNPTTHVNMSFDIRTFEKLNSLAKSLSKCDDDLCVRNQLGVFKFTNKERITDTCETDEKIIMIQNFIARFEECKAYDWNELNITDSCDCGIAWLDSKTIDVKVMKDRLQFIEGGKVIYEHVNANHWSEYNWRYKTPAMNGHSNYIFDVDRDNSRKILLADGDQEIIFGEGEWRNELSLAPFELNRYPTFLSRDKDGIILKKSDKVCNATNRLRSFCYETGQSFLVLDKDNKPVIEQVKVPFSVQLSAD